MAMTPGMFEKALKDRSENITIPEIFDLWDKMKKEYLKNHKGNLLLPILHLEIRQLMSIIIKVDKANRKRELIEIECKEHSELRQLTMFAELLHHSKMTYDIENIDIAVDGNVCIIYLK